MANEPVDAQHPLKGEVVYHPGAADSSPLPLLDFISFLMDRCFVLPGTEVRFGLNAFFLAVPVLGDILPALVSVAILLIGLHTVRVPRIVAARMMLNSLLDISLGWIPVIGDLFDMYFKADTRNVRLLQEYAGWSNEPPRGTWRHWLVVLGLVGLTLLIVGLLVFGAVALVEWLVRLAHGGA